VVVHSAGAATAARPMAITLLEVALGLRAHQDARVRRAVAYAMLVSFQAGGALQLSSECALHFSAPELRP